MSYEKFYSLQRDLDTAAKSGSPAEQADLCRKLAATLGRNIAEAGWEPLAGINLVKEYVRGANRLVDDQDGINNYADMSLSEASKFTNHSKKWKTSLNFEDDSIQKLLEQHKPISDAAQSIQSNHDAKLLEVLKTDVKFVHASRKPKTSERSLNKTIKSKSSSSVPQPATECPDFDILTSRSGF